MQALLASYWSSRERKGRGQGTGFQDLAGAGSQGTNQVDKSVHDGRVEVLTALVLNVGECLLV
jgi:hypothetical protein